MKERRVHYKEKVYPIKLDAWARFTHPKIAALCHLYNTIPVINAANPIDSLCCLILIL